MKARKINTQSIDIINIKISVLKKHFPECITEGKIDLDKLKTSIGQTTDINDEKYTLSWAGRNETFKNIQIRAKGTLIPDKMESTNFDDAKNIFIEGENLEVLKLLQKSYFGKIKCIYIDPPYNTGNDFIYKDDFRCGIDSYLEQTGQADGGINLSTNPDSSGRYHSDWISFMYARLSIARNLLSDDGIIFVSIDDNEIYNLRFIMNEIFGEENFRNSIVIKRGTSNIQSQFSGVRRLKIGYESVIMFSKNSEYSITKPIIDENMEKSGMWNNHWRSTDRPTLRYALFGITPKTGTWRWSEKRSLQAIENYENMIQELKKSKKDITQTNIDEWYIKNIEDEQIEKIDLLRISKNGKPEHFVPPNRSKLLTDVWYDVHGNGSRKLKTLLGGNYFDNPKSLNLLKRILSINVKQNDIILDFFAGSGTTAQAVMELNEEDGGNRKFICIQIPEMIDKKKNKDTYQFLKKIKKPINIAEITKERIRQVAKILDPSKNQDLGFKVFKLVKSNYKIWENYNGKDDEELKRQIKLFESPLVSNYKDIDVIYECIIKEGLGLNAKIKKIISEPNKIYKIVDDERCFYICLDKKIKKIIIEKTKIGIEDTLFCIDSALTDTQKANISRHCRLRVL